MCVVHLHLLNYSMKKPIKNCASKEDTHQRKRLHPPGPPIFFTAMTWCLYLIPRCHFRDLAKSLWDSSAYFKVSFYLINLAYFRNFPAGWIWGTEQEQAFMLLELSGEVQSCIYHLCRCHPQLINCISCQWRTLKVTTEIKKNKTTSQLEWWHVQPAGVLKIILIIQHKRMNPWWILQWSLNMDVMTAFNIFETFHMSESIQAQGHVLTHLHLT